MGVSVQIFCPFLHAEAHREFADCTTTRSRRCRPSRRHSYIVPTVALFPPNHSHPIRRQSLSSRPKSVRFAFTFSKTMQSSNNTNNSDYDYQKNKKFRNKKKPENVDGKFKYELDTCSKHKDLAGAIALYESGIAKNIRLNNHHFNILLYLCSNSVTDASTKDSAIDYGFRIFDHMVSSNIPPNEATITALARLAAAKGDGDYAFELVKGMGKYGVMPKLRSYDPALLCFCGNFEADKAYEVEEHMNSMGVSMEEMEISTLLKVSAEKGIGDKVYEYLHKLRNTVRCVSESTAEVIENWFRSGVASDVGSSDCDVGRIKEAMLKNGGGWHGQGWIGNGKWVLSRSNVDPTGRCGSCAGQLVCVDIDKMETEKFAQSVASLALEREVKANIVAFMSWLDRHANYEAVVDAANVGLYRQNFADGGFSISQVDAVVKELYNRSNPKKWPLVILHIKRVRGLMENPHSRKVLEEWKARGVLYSTPSGSNDDWYWLYAAVKNKCLLVTNDEMRDHIFEIVGSSFILKWKERHQVHYTFVKGNIKLLMPPPYSSVIQESEKGTWHVPLAGECDDESRAWLCITRPSLFNSDVTSKNVLHGCSNSSPVIDNKTIKVTGKRKDRSPSPQHQSIPR